MIAVSSNYQYSIFKDSVILSILAGPLLYYFGRNDLDRDFAVAKSFLEPFL